MELLIKSSIDGSLEPSLFYPASRDGRPLLVGLHTWSFDRFNQVENLLPIAQKYDFNLLLPEFRGPNLKSNSRASEACGSPLAKADIKDAIDYVIEHEGVDRENIFLIGLSGGGHMALLMCGLCPKLFRAVAAFVPITDLALWAEENPNYREHIYASAGDDMASLLSRSPISYIDTIAQANLKIFHGKYDGVVPVTHSTRLYDEIFKKYPKSRVFLDIFDGGHEIDLDAAMFWLISQYENKGNVAVTG